MPFITSVKDIDKIGVGYEWEFGLKPTPDSAATTGGDHYLHYTALPADLQIPSQHWLVVGEHTGRELNFRGPKPLSQVPSLLKELHHWIDTLKDRGVFIGTDHVSPPCGNHVHINVNPALQGVAAVSGPHLFNAYMEKFQSRFWDLCDIDDGKFRGRLGYNSPVDPKTRWADVARVYDLDPNSTSAAPHLGPQRWSSSCGNPLCEICLPSGAPRPELTSDPESTSRFEKTPKRTRRHPVGKGGDFSIRWRVTRRCNDYGGGCCTAELRMWNSSMDPGVNKERYHLLSDLLATAVRDSTRTLLPVGPAPHPAVPDRAQRRFVLRDSRGRFTTAAQEVTAR